MNIRKDKVKKFYLDFLPEAKLDGNIISVPCPFCRKKQLEDPGTLIRGKFLERR